MAGVIWESEDTGDIVSLRMGGIMRDAKKSPDWASFA